MRYVAAAIVASRLGAPTKDAAPARPEPQRAPERRRSSFGGLVSATLWKAVHPGR